MTTITFDTLAYVKTLREAGIPEPQAEAQATALAAVLKSGTGELATKTDLAELKYEMLKWVVGLALAQVGLLVTILLKLSH